MRYHYRREVLPLPSLICSPPRFSAFQMYVILNKLYLCTFLGHIMRHTHASSLLSSIRKPNNAVEVSNSMSSSALSTAHRACFAWLKSWTYHRTTYAHIDTISNLSMSGLV